MTTLSALTDPNAVLRAIEEFDELGREEFLRRYGYRKARSYRVVHDGRSYDSKAIAGVALKYQEGAGTPLLAADFGGGDATVKRKLKSLGFDVIEDEAEAAGQPSQSPVRGAVSEGGRGYDWTPDQVASCVAAYVEMLDLESAGSVYVKADFNRRVQQETGRSKSSVEWKMRNVSDVLAKLGLPWLGGYLPAANAQGDAIEAALLRAAQGHRYLTEAIAGPLILGLDTPSIKPGDADEEPFDPANATDARKKIVRAIKARRGQTKFRNALLTAYGQRCAISGCAVVGVLEAAHITPYLGPQTNHVTNGLLLRADLHTLFDMAMISVDPASRMILVSPSIQDNDYRALHGKPLRAAAEETAKPSPFALKKHRALCAW